MKRIRRLKGLIERATRICGGCNLYRAVAEFGLFVYCVNCRAKHPELRKARVS